MSFWVGIDENGLGARLGPLLVTGVLARVSEDGARFLRRKLPKSMRLDLDDSKALVSNKNYRLGEAWARVLVRRSSGKDIDTPGKLLTLLSLYSDDELRAPCPKSSEKQCFAGAFPEFLAEPELLERIETHVEFFESRGVDLKLALSSILCTGRLNTLRRAGTSRFSADLHEMERLLLAFREASEAPLVATLGKVGGMGQYGKFFGPLSGRLHSILEESHEKSSYHFPDLGQLTFLKDADAKAPLVMLASLVGKYLREITMGRISNFYESERDFAKDEDYASPSGYHDPVTTEFVRKTTSMRKRLKIADDCFERLSVESVPALPKPKKKPAVPSGQSSLF